jgi:hypothetical protein
MVQPRQPIEHQHAALTDLPDDARAKLEAKQKP